MDKKTHTIISDQGRGAIIVKQLGASGSIAIVFFTTIKDSDGRILRDKEATCQVIKAESSEKAYADACEWAKRNINQECEFKEGYKFIDTVNYIIKSIENEDC